MTKEHKVARSEDPEFQSPNALWHNITASTAKFVRGRQSKS